jgi:hypothetical protein
VVEDFHENLEASSLNSKLIVVALFAAVAACGVVVVHLHPELIDSVKGWFAGTVRIPRI